MAPGPVRIICAGMPRCGTTLVTSLLHQQPGVRFVTDYVHWLSEVSSRLEVSLRQPLSPAQRRMALAMARDSLIRVRHPVLLGLDDFATLDELHRGVADELAGGERLAVGHKALLDVPEVEALLAETDVHVLLLLRDPRAAALSYLHRVGGGVEHYLEDLKAMARFARSCRDRRLAVLRFEDVLADPRAALDPVCAFWGARAEVPDGLSFHRGDGETAWSENSAFGDVGHATDTPIDPTPAERWRREDTHPVVRFADHTCRGLMRDWGYEPLEAGWSRARVRAASHALLWRADRRAERWITRSRRFLLERLAPPL